MRRVTQVIADPSKGGGAHLGSSLTRPPRQSMRLSAGAPQTPPRTHPFVQEHGQHPGGRGPLLAAQIRNRNLGTATERCLPMPTAGDGASRPSGLRRRGSPRAAREWQALRTPAWPRAPTPPFPRAPGLTMAAARAGPAQLGQRRRDPRPELRADLAAPPAPALRPECGPAGGGARGGGGGGASQPRAGSAPPRMGG